MSDTSLLLLFTAKLPHTLSQARTSCQGIGGIHIGHRVTTTTSPASEPHNCETDLQSQESFHCLYALQGRRQHTHQLMHTKNSFEQHQMHHHLETAQYNALDATSLTANNSPQEPSQDETSFKNQQARPCRAMQLHANLHNVLSH